MRGCISVKNACVVEDEDAQMNIHHEYSKQHANESFYLFILFQTGRERGKPRYALLIVLVYSTVTP